MPPRSLTWSPAPRRVAVYANTLQGIYGAGTAPTGVAFFGGEPCRVDRGRQHDSDLVSGIYDFTGGTNCTVPEFFSIYQNNTITHVHNGIWTSDVGSLHGEEATVLGIVFRHNTMSGVDTAGWQVDALTGPTMDAVIFEHSTITERANRRLYALGPACGKRIVSALQGYFQPRGGPAREFPAHL